MTLPSQGGCDQQDQRTSAIFRGFHPLGASLSAHLNQSSLLIAPLPRAPPTSSQLFALRPLGGQDVCWNSVTHIPDGDDRN